MNDTTLIANQARELATLREYINHALEALDRAHSALVCVGAPLNDDVLQCTREQRALFGQTDHRIQNAIGWLREDIGRDLSDPDDK